MELTNSYPPAIAIHKKKKMQKGVLSRAEKAVLRVQICLLLPEKGVASDPLLTHAWGLKPTGAYYE
jgi:hypothetical protein